jgi:hypothetical protein
VAVTSPDRLPTVAASGLRGWAAHAAAGHPGDSLAVDLTILAVLVAATLVLAAVTRGRLGFQPTTAVAGGEGGGEPLAERSSR